MRHIALSLVSLALTGCFADIRPAIDATDQHVRAMKTAARAEHIPAQERLELISFHVTRGLGWTTAMIKHKGPPAEGTRITIPRSPEDKREIEEEDLGLDDYNVDIDTEEDLKAKGRGWLTKVVGGGTLATVASALALFNRYKKKVRGIIKGKDRAIDAYDRVVDENLTQAKRIAVGGDPDMKREHAVRKNGGGTA